MWKQRKNDPKKIPGPPCLGHWGLAQGWHPFYNSPGRQLAFALCFETVENFFPTKIFFFGKKTHLPSVFSKLGFFRIKPDTIFPARFCTQIKEKKTRKGKLHFFLLLCTSVVIVLKLLLNAFTRKAGVFFYALLVFPRFILMWVWSCPTKKTTNSVYFFEGRKRPIFLSKMQNTKSIGNIGVGGDPSYFDL